MSCVLCNDCACENVAGVSVHSTRGRNWQFLQDKVPPLLVQIQAPADNQFESMLPTIHVSLPGHSSRQLSEHCARFSRINFGKIFVYFFTCREFCSAPVDTRHQDRFHRTKLCVHKQISSFLMYKETSLRNLPTVDINHPPHMRVVLVSNDQNWSFLL